MGGVFLESWKRRGAAMHESGFIQAALQGGQRVIGMSLEYIVHIRHVSQNHWNVLDFFNGFAICVYSLAGATLL